MNIEQIAIRFTDRPSPTPGDVPIDHLYRQRWWLPIIGPILGVGVREDASVARTGEAHPSDFRPALPVGVWWGALRCCGAAVLRCCVGQVVGL